MTQATLFDIGSDSPDTFYAATRKPVIKHPGHSLAAMQKPFIAWDGEGYTDEFGQHHYWLISNSLGARIVAPPGRSLHRHNITRLFMETHAANPSAIHVGFALGYDFTCILRGNGISTSALTDLAQSQSLRSDGWVYKLMMGKMLTIWQESASNKGGRFVLQDTFGFFQRSFVKALDEYFGKDWPYRDEIVAMKAQRGNFDREHDAETIHYNDCELELLVMLMEELRDRLFQTGMPVSRWYGPGGIASGLLNRWKIKSTFTDLYEQLPEVARASQHAYAGGRFELFRPGHSNGPVFQYDINSAYPFAIAQLPNLADGNWVHHVKPDLRDLSEFSVCRVSWDTAMGMGGASIGTGNLSEVYPESIPFPFFRRLRNDNICYPSHGIEGWYWMPEVLAGIEYSEKLHPGYDVRWEILEAWEFQPNDERWYTLRHNNARFDHTGLSIPDWSSWNRVSGIQDVLPFYHVPQLYALRQKLKAQGSGANIGIKLGLNSLYGKLAQQIGWDPKTGKKPPFHNLAAAGWVTSMCRATLLRAMATDPAAIIATETDGIFSTRPLPLTTGSGLGEWDPTTYDDMYYFSSGFRFGIVGGEVYKPATRGVPARDISLEKILDTVKDSQSFLEVEQTQFLTLNWAVAMNQHGNVGNWKTGKKSLLLMCEEPTGKRYHDFNCPSCQTVEDGRRIYSMEWEHLTIPNPSGSYELSYPHKIAWIDGSDTKNQQEDAELDSLFEI